MARIDVADDPASWMMLRPELGVGLAGFSEAVYGNAQLPLREREIARMRIAHINDCHLCRNTRHEQGAARGADESLYRKIDNWRAAPGFSERERLAAEFAERFALDHLAMNADDAFWARLRAAYSDAEVVELTISVALWLGVGRAMRVLDVGQACAITLQA
ncbi:carboxymuconolactone decarboxylase family protein [Oleomonas cavernae]|uniref:Carboxymuconolactone decarboxylase family protein n=1 Tax=Oleomonas cavernae TaxID=2320859 RepID=A0A418W9Y1_9PROT|nr:carboxymuconolactone decarboxylase family protein [Oleomonas cavernae]RJF86820.1 carboxymuconolactone decarboxylase family protein [Oleomonas cavernae]